MLLCWQAAAAAGMPVAASQGRASKLLAMLLLPATNHPRAHRMIGTTATQAHFFAPVAEAPARRRKTPCGAGKQESSQQQPARRGARPEEECGVRVLLVVGLSRASPVENQGGCALLAEFPPLAGGVWRRPPGCWLAAAAAAFSAAASAPQHLTGGCCALSASWRRPRQAEGLSLFRNRQSSSLLLLLLRFVLLLLAPRAHVAACGASC